MALLARFACGCLRRVEIPAPPSVACSAHGARARLISLPSGQVRYQTEPLTGEPASRVPQGPAQQPPASAGASSF